MKMPAIAIQPIDPSAVRPSRTSSGAMTGTSPTWLPIAPKMRIAWVRRKSMKIGASTLTDSFTPRRFSTTSSTMAAPSAGTFQTARCGGKKLQMASPPAAIDTEMVST
jgi:hypothetical protein